MTENIGKNLIVPTDPEPHCGGRECGVAPGHYDTACDCPCAVCARQRDALEEVRQ